MAVEEVKEPVDLSPIPTATLYTDLTSNSTEPGRSSTGREISEMRLSWYRTPFLVFHWLTRATSSDTTRRVHIHKSATFTSDTLNRSQSLNRVRSLTSTIETYNAVTITKFPFRSRPDLARAPPPSKSPPTCPAIRSTFP